MSHALAQGCYSQPSLVVTQPHGAPESNMVDVGAVFRVTSDMVQIALALSPAAAQEAAVTGKPGCCSRSRSAVGTQVLCRGLAVHVCDEQRLLRTLPLCRELPAGCSYTSAAVAISRSALCDGDMGLVLRFVLPAELWENKPILYLGPNVKPAPQARHAPRARTTPSPVNFSATSPSSASPQLGRDTAPGASYPPRPSGRLATSPACRALLPGPALAGPLGGLTPPSPAGAPYAPASAAGSLLMMPKPPTCDAAHPGRPHPMLGAHKAVAFLQKPAPSPLEVHPVSCSGPGPLPSPGLGSPLRRSRLSVCTSPTVGLTPRPPLASPCAGCFSEPCTPAGRCPCPPAGAPPKVNPRQKLAALPPAASLGVPAVLSP